MIDLYVTIPLMLIAIGVAIVPLLLHMMHKDSFGAIDASRALAIDWTSPLERTNLPDHELAIVE